MSQEETTEAVSSDFEAKLNVFLQKKGKSVEDVRTIVTPASMPSAVTNEGLIAALGQTRERYTPPSYEGVGYRKLRFFSGIQPTPVGEDDFESWMDQAVQMMEEWQCSDTMKRQRLAESLRGPASDVIRSIRVSKPSAGAMEYLHALDDIYGTTESEEDLCVRFCTTYQEEGEKLSQYVCRLEKLLHKVLVKKGILASRLDQVRMEQILKGACSGNLIALKLQLSDSRQNPPSFSKLVRDIREEED
ncbi:paraneoplastic antigen Ma1 homolog [Pelodiscus sinensis]|uniref:paraneoplastic antigen Ma1 homolog n=1 Tax=Pelodiscus sinensis TaxID=13735 RepID=UPI003F6BFA0C